MRLHTFLLLMAASVSRVVFALPDDATGSEIGAVGDVMIIDVSAGSSAESYPVTYLEGVDIGRFNCDAYKTGKIVLRKVPAGTYAAAPRRGGTIAEDANLTVTVPYYIGVFLVTQKQYENVMGSVPDGQSQAGSLYPVSCLSWTGWRGVGLTSPTSPIAPDAASSSFLPRLMAKADLEGLDLPTEGQWEVAARAGSRNEYGSVLVDGVEKNAASYLASSAWFTYNNTSGGYPAGVKPVGVRYPNCWGLYDTMGNLREWCRDGISDAYRASVEVPDEGANPEGWSRVTRGGAYSDGQWCIAASYMVSVDRSSANTVQGARLVCPVQTVASVSLLRATSRWPWNGKVDVGYSLEGLRASRSYELVTSVAVSNVSVSVTNVIPSASGERAAVIDCDELLGGEIDDVATVTLGLLEKSSDSLPADATGDAIGVRGDIMIIDVSAGAMATSYPVTYLDGVDMGRFNCDAYKTGKIVLRKVPAGTYAARPGGSGALPESAKLTVANDYYIGQFEVTQKQYQNVMGSVPDGQTQTGETYPVSKLNWGRWREDVLNPLSAVYPKAESASFLPRLAAKAGLPGLDMPTEGQWEVATRANSTASYGEYLKNGVVCDSYSGTDDIAWFTYNNTQEIGGYPPGVKPVGLKCPNRWGLYDTSGNVCEWCRDIKIDAFGASVDVPEAESAPNSWTRVVRGGGYGDGMWTLSASDREGLDRSSASAGAGLRLACTMRSRRAAISPAPDATGAPVGIRADLAVVDISAGSAAASYPIVRYKNVDVGFFNCNAYKTDKIVLRKINAGTYRIKPNAYPPATDCPAPGNVIVIKKDFHIGLFEVTQRQYLNVVGAWPWSGESKQAQKGDDRPIGFVSWADIRGSILAESPVQSNASGAFCERLLAKTGECFDLPTEAQWEIAARGGYSFASGAFVGEAGLCENIDGLSLTNSAWCTANNETAGYPKGQKPVGLLAPNPMGLYDTLGNIAEWCRDGYSATFSYDYADEPCPTPTDGKVVYRGGAWASATTSVNLATRASFTRGTQYDQLGFRVGMMCR